MPKKSLTEDFNSVVEKCFNLLEQTSEIERNVYNDVFDILYSSKEDYIHHYPRTLFLQVTSGCNLRCKHCFFNDNPEKYNTNNDLTKVELFEQLKFFVEDANILYCILTGGEIFTCPYIFEIIEYLKEHSITVKLVTNGTLISEDIAKKLGKYLTRHDIIQVSLEAPEAEINDEIRGKGVFNKVINSIKYLVKNKLNVEIAITANSINTDYIPQMYLLSKELKVKRLNIGRFTAESSEQEYLIPTTENLFYNISKLYDIYSKTEVQLLIPCIKIPDFLKFEKGQNLLDKKLSEKTFSRQNFHCKKHHEQAALFANGNIALCYECNINDVIIGNIKNNSFDEIWKNRFTTPMFQPRLIDNHLCKKCKYIQLCLSGCPYRAFIKYGTLNAPGIECSYFNTLGEQNEQ